MFRPIVRNIRMKRLYHAILGTAMLQGAQRIIATAEQERQELISRGYSRRQDYGPQERNRNTTGAAGTWPVSYSMGYIIKCETCIILGTSSVQEKSGNDVGGFFPLAEP